MFALAALGIAVVGLLALLGGKKKDIAPSGSIGDAPRYSGKWSIGDLVLTTTSEGPLGKLNGVISDIEWDPMRQEYYIYVRDSEGVDHRKPESAVVPAGAHDPETSQLFALEVFVKGTNVTSKGRRVSGTVQGQVTGAVWVWQYKRWNYSIRDQQGTRFDVWEGDLEIIEGASLEPTAAPLYTIGDTLVTAEGLTVTVTDLVWVAHVGRWLYTLRTEMGSTVSKYEVSLSRYEGMTKIPAGGVSPEPTAAPLYTIGDTLVTAEGFTVTVTDLAWIAHVGRWLYTLRTEMGSTVSKYEVSLSRYEGMTKIPANGVPIWDPRAGP